MSDRIFGVFGLALALILIGGSMLVEDSFIQDPLGPRAFPYIVAALMVTSCLAMVLRPDLDPDWPGPKKTLELLAVIAAMVIYVMALPIVGYLISSAALCAVLIRRLGGNTKQSVIGGGITSGLTFMIFAYGLQLSIARGPWGF
jgi:putative tricarboxylic transport membrane protein